MTGRTAVTRAWTQRPLRLPADIGMGQNVPDPVAHWPSREETEVSGAEGPPPGWWPPPPPAPAPLPKQRGVGSVLLVVGIALVTLVGISIIVLPFAGVLLYSQWAGDPGPEIDVDDHDVVGPMYVIGRGSDVVVQRFPCPHLPDFPGIGTVQLTYYTNEDDDEGTVLWDAKARLAGTEEVAIGEDQTFTTTVPLRPIPKSGETILSFSAWGNDDYTWEAEYWPELVSDGVGYLDTSGGLKRGSEGELLAREPSDLDCP